MNFKATALMAVLFLATGSIADDDECDTCGAYYRITNSRYQNFLGLSAGMSTGYGVSFRKWLNSKYGVQIAIFPLIRNETYPDDFTIDPFANSYASAERDSGDATYGYASLGISGFRSFADTKYLRFLGFAAINVFVNYEDYDYYYEDYVYTPGSGSRYETVHKVGKKHEEQLSLGAGAGVEYYIWRFCLNFMVGVVGGYKIQSQGYSLTPSIDGGLFFRF